MMAERVHHWAESLITTNQAHGEARGAISMILELLRDGDINAERAWLRLQHFHEQRRISDDDMHQALLDLPG